MSHVVQECCGPHDCQITRVDVPQCVALTKEAHGQSRQMIRPYRVLKPGMGGARIHKKRQSQLPHITQALHGDGVQQPQGQWIESDIVPERIAQNFHSAKLPHAARLHSCQFPLAGALTDDAIPEGHTLETRPDPTEVGLVAWVRDDTEVPDLAAVIQRNREAPCIGVNIATSAVVSCLRPLVRCP